MVVLALIGRWIFFTLLDSEVYTDRDRLFSGITEVQIQGMQVIATELLSADINERSQRLDAIGQDFHLPIELRPLTELSNSQQTQLRDAGSFVCEYRSGFVDFVGVHFDSESYLRLGPLASQAGVAIEDALDEWLRFLTRRIEEASCAEEALADLSRNYGIHASLVLPDTLSRESRRELASGRASPLFVLGDDSYMVMPMRDREDWLRMGPLPKVRETARKSLNQAMAIFYVCVFGTTGWLVFSLSRRLNRVELAAQKLSEGHLDTRVDEGNAGEAKALATSFNEMASKLETSIQSQKELLQFVSHELRTPLSRLRFAVELLDLSKHEEMRQSRMLVLQQSIDNLESIVDEVFEYVRKNEAMGVGKCEWLEVEACLEPIIAVHRTDRPNVQFEWFFSGTPIRSDVYAERIAFQRLMSNLLSNAVRFAVSTVRIHVYPASSEDLGLLIDSSEERCAQALCIDIEDDGPGIPVDRRVDALKPFVRLSTPAQYSTVSGLSNEPLNAESAAGDEPKLFRTDRQKGLGLGLAIVDRIIKQHGGAMSLNESDLGGCLVRTIWPIPEH